MNQEIQPDRSGHLEVGGQQIWWEYFGKGDREVVCLLNGLAMHTKAWYGFLPQLIDDYDVILYDFLGQGESSKEDVPYVIDELARYLALIMDENGVDKIHPMGISYGGFIALEFARLYPERLHTLVLSGILASREKLFDMYQDISLAFYRGDEAIFELYTHYMYEKIFSERFVKNISDEQLAAMRQRFYDRYIDYRYCLIRLTEAQDPFFANIEERVAGYREVTAPTLIIAGAHDRAIPLWQQEKLADIFPNSRYELVPESGHVVYIERPDIFFPALKRFMAAKSVDFKMPNGQDAGANPVILYHRVDGEGEPLLLLNGVAMTVSSWEPVARIFSESFRLVRCDFRGQLMMPVRPHADVAGHAEDVVALLDHLEIETTSLVGTSFGGVIATLVAGRYPERVRSLVTIAAAHGFYEEMADEVELWKVACRQSLDGGDRGHLSDVLDPIIFSPAYIESHSEERAIRRAQIAALPDCWFEGLFGLLDSAHSVRLRSELAAIQCPTMVVAADLDAFVPLDRTRGLAESIGGARFESIQGAGHAVVVEQPQRVAELCLEFLANVERF